MLPICRFLWKNRASYPFGLEIYVAQSKFTNKFQTIPIATQLFVCKICVILLVLGRVVHIRDAGDSGQRVRGSSTCPRVSLSPNWTVMDRQQVTAVPEQPHNAHTRLWTKLSYSLEKYAACPQSHTASLFRALTSGLQPCLSSLTSALL